MIAGKSNSKGAKNDKSIKEITLIGDYMNSINHGYYDL